MVQADHGIQFLPQYSFMPQTKKLRISQKHLMRAIFMQNWQLEVILWFMTEKYVHYLKVMKTYFHAVVISTSSDRNRPILQPAGASDERLWVLVCALGSTEGLQVHAEPSKFRVIKHMAWPVHVVEVERLVFRGVCHGWMRVYLYITPVADHSDKTV